MEGGGGAPLRLAMVATNIYLLHHRSCHSTRNRAVWIYLQRLNVAPRSSPTIPIAVVGVVSATSSTKQIKFICNILCSHVREWGKKKIPKILYPSGLSKNIFFFSFRSVRRRCLWIIITIWIIQFLYKGNKKKTRTNEYRTNIQQTERITERPCLFTTVNLCILYRWGRINIRFLYFSFRHLKTDFHSIYSIEKWRKRFECHCDIIIFLDAHRERAGDGESVGARRGSPKFVIVIQ